MYQFQKLCFINPPDQILQTTTTNTPTDEAETTTLHMSLLDRAQTIVKFEWIVDNGFYVGYRILSVGKSNHHFLRNL